VENAYILLQQIYSGNGIPNFIRITRVLWKILQKTFRYIFLDTLCNYTYTRREWAKC